MIKVGIQLSAASKLQKIDFDQTDRTVSTQELTLTSKETDQTWLGCMFAKLVVKLNQQWSVISLLNQSDIFFKFPLPKTWCNQERMLLIMKIDPEGRDLV